MSTANKTPSDDSNKVRLDKWLWAARFYKTRALAKSMIEGGKIYYDGQRAKPSREVALGAEIRLRQGNDEKTVLVTGISDKRGSAVLASQLYRETEASLVARQRLAEQRRLLPATAPGPDARPTKKQRRQIIHFQQHDANQDTQ